LNEPGLLPLIFRSAAFTPCLFLLYGGPQVGLPPGPIFPNGGGRSRPFVSMSFLGRLKRPPFSRLLANHDGYSNSLVTPGFSWLSQAFPLTALNSR